ncbi:serine/threonine-protein kinase [Actinosynnema sp. NPDC047251]|uniref:non-specific serine/threonine protein kinase n=1 Tax=Saccharothrix espanaensis (strain ATCC 51144 / DSM 44229 / JCM 9112 / NBRC 15066 / NRRL 15764) TaxID=1179773 RepID=K0K1J4_SACES|nr:serine/threonine-protein kinase [Saccharothrix espanaensis]CCH32206.1 Serine/threonine protein kinase [Saccharothrix espanaensis DSM 44229]
MSEREHTGRILDGRFELLERLGSGGMGTVWRALDLGLHREVAIKEVRPHDAEQIEANPAMAAQLRERVLRESRALARLQHPNVVSIYQIIDSPDSPYPWIVMELVRGTSLDARLSTGVLTPAEAARVGRDVLAALRSAHSAGVLHRDVKPGNVLLRTDGSAVLTDFGIAALHGSTQLTATGDVIGSPEYIAPERLRGDETHTASDFWSLAMLLYVAVEGNHPMRRATTMATLAAVMTEQVPPPRRAGALAPALNAALRNDPADRPSGEVLDQMFAAAERDPGPRLGPPTPAGFPVPGPPSGPQPPLQYPQWQSGPTPAPVGGPLPHGYPASYPTPLPRRRPTGAVVLSLVAVALVVTTVLLVISSNGADNSANSGTGTQTTPVTTQPNVVLPTGPTTTTTAAVAATKDDLLTPAGARKAVGALGEVMGGTKVSELTLWSERATATAPTAAVANGFDEFVYTGGKATRYGPDGVDADRAVLDLNDVNWDALPALFDRAVTDLGVPKPTMRYVIISTGIIDGKATVRVYLADDYGGAYLQADLKGEVQKLYPR